MRRHLAELLLALFLLGACADDEPAASTASTTTMSTAGGTSTSAPEQTSATSQPGRANCRQVATSSPATFDAKQGTYSTYITKFDETTSTVSFDVVQWLSGEDAVEAYHKDNPDDPSGPPNDYEIVNESDRVRSAAVTDGAEVWLVRLRATGNASLKPGSLGELAEYLAQGYPEDVFWLTMSGGSVVDLCEQYRP